MVSRGRLACRSAGVENSRMRPRFLTRRFPWILPAMIGLMLFARAVPAQDLALDFKRGFVDGYVRSAVKRGDSPQQAQVDGNCIYDALNAHLTTSQWIELLGAGLMHGSPPPQALRPLMPEIAAVYARCAHLGRSDQASAAPLTGVAPSDPEPGADGSTAQADARLDIADSMAVTRQLLRMRMQEVQARVHSGQRPGAPLIARCFATIQVSETGTAAGQPTIHCSNPQVEDVMRQAIVATGALSAQPGSTVLLRVTAPFPSL